MTLLVVGASGLLGGSVAGAARERGERVRGTYLTNDTTEDPGAGTVERGAVGVPRAPP